MVKRRHDPQPDPRRAVRGTHRRRRAGLGADGRRGTLHAAGALRAARRTRPRPTLGAAAVAAYLVLGLIAPVYAQGAGGLAILLGTDGRLPVGLPRRRRHSSGWLAGAPGRRFADQPSRRSRPRASSRSTSWALSGSRGSSTSDSAKALAVGVVPFSRSTSSRPPSPPAWRWRCSGRRWLFLRSSK